MWIKTDSGMLNLDHAFEMSYDPNKEELTVWWSFPLPKAIDSESRKFAEIYDVERMTGHRVTALEWNRFMHPFYYNDQLVQTIKVLLDNEPDVEIADGGHTVLDLWRHNARELLGIK